MKSVSLRVFRRTRDNISFLFNDNAVSDLKLEDLKIYNFEDKEKKNPLIHMAAVDTKTETVQVVVDHARNDLDANKTYIFVFDFKTFDVNIKVYPSEVLPLFEKDSVGKNQHLYCWFAPERRWVKLSAVKDEKTGLYCLAVKKI